MFSFFKKTKVVEYKAPAPYIIKSETVSLAPPKKITCRHRFTSWVGVLQDHFEWTASPHYIRDNNVWPDDKLPENLFEPIQWGDGGDRWHRRGLRSYHEDIDPEPYRFTGLKTGTMLTHFCVTCLKKQVFAICVPLTFKDTSISKQFFCQTNGKNMIGIGPDETSYRNTSWKVLKEDEELGTTELFLCGSEFEKYRVKGKFKIDLEHNKPFPLVTIDRRQRQHTYDGSHVRGSIEHTLFAVPMELYQKQRDGLENLIEKKFSTKERIKFLIETGIKSVEHIEETDPFDQLIKLPKSSTVLSPSGM